MRFPVLLSVIFALSLSAGGLYAETVKLQGLYATSVKQDYMQHGPHKLFDGREDAWVSVPGTGPDEGIMLYFEKPVFISSLKIKTASAGDYTAIKRVLLYRNGIQSFGEPVNSVVSINMELQSLFIRIIDLEGLAYDKSEAGTTYQVFKSSKSVAIEELEFSDKKGDKLSVIAPFMIPGKISAGSVLKPQEAYQTDFLFDSRNDFGWADGNDKKTGQNEWLKFSFNENVTISKIRLWNGYQRSGDHFAANERVKTFSFGSGAQDDAVYTVKDSFQPVDIELKNPLTAREFVLKVTDIYAGKKYKDLVISELRFSDGNNWFGIYSGEAEKWQKETASRIKNTPLEKAVNRRLSKYYQGGDGSMEDITLLLRSNGSFVLWNKSSTAGEKNSEKQMEYVADGNWEIRELSKDKAKLKIFGKLYYYKASLTSYDPYRGKSGDDKVDTGTVIFSEIITVDWKAVKGDKIISTVLVK